MANPDHASNRFMELIKLAQKIVDMFEEAPAVETHRKTFGQWVMTKFYSDLQVQDQLYMNEFWHARRTSDGQLYLASLLRLGTLPDDRLH